MRWTEEMDAILKRMHADNNSFSQIGDRLGMNRSCIAGRVHRLGLAREPITGDPMQRPWTEEETKLAIELWKEGQSASQIARRLIRRSRNAVISLLYRNGLTSAHGGAGKNVKKAHFRKPSVLADFPVEPLPAEDTLPANLIALVDLEPHQCKWIYGDPKTSQSGCCGKQQVIGLPYCIDHARRAYRPVEIKGNLHLLDINEARKVKARRVFA